MGDMINTCKILVGKPKKLRKKSHMGVTGGFK
jgi:hypothetical protein